MGHVDHVLHQIGNVDSESIDCTITNMLRDLILHCPSIKQDSEC